MIALSSVTQGGSAVAGRRAASRADADGDFAQALATLTGDDGSDSSSQPLTVPVPAQRQDAADDGKTLPDPGAPATLDPRLLWLPAGLLQTAPGPLAANPATAAPQPVAAPSLAATDPLAMSVAPDTGAVATDDTAKALAKLAGGDHVLPNTLADLFHAGGRSVAPAAVAAVMPVQAQPQPAPTLNATVSTDVASLGLDPTARDERKKANADPVLQPTSMTTEVALRNAVQPTSDTRHVPLDLRGDTGLQKMIDHIETLRDGADASDTRIRLVPDALGTVDVAVRREGDAVHVHFTAETAATRTLLNDAQPRLAELAEQRGVRIAGSSVDAGTGGGGQHAQSQRQPQAVTTNHITTTTIEAAGDDARLA